MTDTDVLDDIGWVFWSATIGIDSTIAARVEAAQAAGFTRVSIGPLDVLRASEDGTSPADLARSLRDIGLDIVMDPLMGWHGEAPLPGPYASLRVDDILQMCDALQVVSISAIGPFSAGDERTEDFARSYAVLCDRAADLGAQVQLEFMPFTVIADLTSAWSIVAAAGCDNGGILFDTWHFFRGNPDLSALDRVPGDRIFGVQIADAPSIAHGSLTEETFHRLLPGDGELDLEAAIRRLDEIGALRWVGPEVISPDTAAMAPADAGRLTGTRVRDLIAAVRVKPAASRRRSRGRGR